MKETKYTKELLEPIVKESFSISQVLDKLSLKKTGGNYRQINMRIRFYDLDRTHFTGKLWNKGKTKKNNDSVMNRSKKLSSPDSDIFIENSSYCWGPRIIERLISSGERTYRCEICGIDEWMNNPITLHLDHINGINNDNSKENLQIICPNCHQQTKTWGCKRNKH